MKFSISIIGDLMVDMICSLNDISLLQAVENKMHETTIQTRVGGTAFSFLRAAHKIGLEHIYVIGKVGADRKNRSSPDFAGALITDQIHKFDATPLVAYSKSHGTGNVLIVYLPEDKRLMLADSGANKSFSLLDITKEMEHAVAETSILLISATCFLFESRREAIMHLMKIAHRSETLIMVDVVPHIIYKYFDFHTFKQYTKHANGLIMENNTAKRFLKTEDFSACDDETDKIASILLQDYQLIILKPNNEQQIIYNNLGMSKKETTGYNETHTNDKVGHSEWASLSILNHYLMTFRSKHYAKRGIRVKKSVRAKYKPGR
ncbi:MAG: carbohydrate kinase family protein [Desulfobacterales bacterium]|nr:carbohydrate kinase family protein [Desulfobacterales bacterium]